MYVYLIIICKSVVKTKSSPPTKTPTIRLTAITTNVNRITSARDGHVTFLSSSCVSLKKETGVVINVSIGTKHYSKCLLTCKEDIARMHIYKLCGEIFFSFDPYQHNTQYEENS